MSVRKSAVGKADLECARHHPTHWGPALNKKEKMLRTPASLSLCLMEVNVTATHISAATLPQGWPGSLLT